MHAVTAPDGTEIAFERRGDGPPLVLVHGSGLTRHVWAGLRDQLVDEATLVVPDRRGRGASGDADEYGLDREVDDLRAVLEATDGTPALFGHSYGGLCALEVARRAPELVDRLVLYEPALLVGEHRDGADIAARMSALLDDGERERAVELFFREAVDTEDVEQLPFWPRPVELAETIAREGRAVERYRLPADLDVQVPTLLLTGEEGPEHLRDGVRTLHERLADSRLAELSGVGHGGVASAPDRVAAEVESFLSET